MKTPLGFRLWIAFVLALNLAILGATFFLIYRIVADPEGAGRFAGRIIGGAISGAQEGK
ncbi:hypothetical protein ACLBYG_22625 [Methylobacterium sp. D53M]